MRGIFLKVRHFVLGQKKNDKTFLNDESFVLHVRHAKNSSVGLYFISRINHCQNFVLKVYIVITSKVFADFCFESPISIDFQSEILALLRPKSAKTFHESLQILSPLRKSA